MQETTYWGLESYGRRVALFGGCLQIYFCGRRGGHSNVEVGCVNIVERPYSGGGRRLQGGVILFGGGMGSWKDLYESMCRQQ